MSVEIRQGDQVITLAEPADFEPMNESLAELSAQVTALDTRVTALENASPPTPPTPPTVTPYGLGQYGFAGVPDDR
jgi:hypothetical protein